MLKLKKPESFELAFPAFLLAALCLNAWLLKLPDINWGIALSGWSALDWVAQLNLPENFTRDFANGIHVYAKTSFMHIYPLAQQWFGVSPENLIPAVILCEIGFLGACAVYFCRTIAPASPPVAAFLFAMLLIGSPVRDMELANFGVPYFWGLYYNIADGLRLLGIALFLRGRVGQAAVLLAASFTVHPIMALMGCAFAFGCLLVERRIAEPRRLAVATALFCAISAVWWWLEFRSADVSSGAIDAQTWISMARAFSFHFFPVDYGMLTIYHDTHVLPLLSLLSLAVFYLPCICPDNRRCNAILAGLLLLGVLSIAGLVISVYVPIPALIKLALPRASDMLILVALAVAVVGLVTDILEGALFWRALAAAVLLSPFVIKPGFPALAVLLLILPRVRTLPTGTAVGRVRVVPLIMCCAAVAWGIAMLKMNILEPRHLPAYIGSLHFWILGGAAGLLTAVAFSMRRMARNMFDVGPIVLIVVVLAIVYLSSKWQAQGVPGQPDRKRGQDYMEVQRWANKNTEPVALFMVDPTIYYGWRDYSARSSFGNLREWLHTSWLYDSRVAQYDEGMKRFNELGIELSPFLTMRPSINGFYRLDAVVRKRFYSMNPQWFTNLAGRYGINYLVLSKNSIQQSYPFSRVFENDSFVVYKVS